MGLLCFWNQTLALLLGVPASVMGFRWRPHGCALVLHGPAGV
jgi:hypothetical protein